MDQELIAYLDARFRETSQQIDDRFQQVDARFEQVHEEIRHTRIEVEGLRSDLRLLAEGMLGIGEEAGYLPGGRSSKLSRRAVPSPGCRTRIWSAASFLWRLGKSGKNEIPSRSSASG